MSVAGTQIADAVYLIKNGAASCASVQIANAATGQNVVWNNTLDANAWLRLNSATQRAETSTDSGASWTRQNANMLGVIPRLRGGVTNTITITGPTTGTRNITYTAKGV
jgi:hypothetical protein